MSLLNLGIYYFLINWYCFNLLLMILNKLHTILNIAEFTYRVIYKLIKLNLYIIMYNILKCIIYNKFVYILRWNR